MQNLQNAAEIQQRVINLVELYRTKVGKESKIAKDAKSFYDKWEEMNKREVSNGGILYQYQDFENPDEITWVKHLMVNEQLLGHFYKEVAGEQVDEEVLAQLLPDEYDSAIYTKEEEAFMKAHFKDMLNYIILTPCDEDLKWVNRHDKRDAFTIPAEVLELINSRVKISLDSQIYYPYAGFAQFANLYKGCKFLFQDKNIWMQMSILANEIDASFFGNEVIPKSYDNVVAYLHRIGEDCKNVTRLYEAYNNMPQGGTFLLLCPTEILTSEIHQVFRNLLIEDKAIKEIIQLPEVMSTNVHSSYCIIIAQKDRERDTITFIDASSAQRKSDKLNYKSDFDIDAFNTLMNNGGVEEATGLRKITTVSYSDVDERIMLPYIYVVERPSESEHPVPLSSICRLVQDRIRDVKSDLPLDTPRISHKDLSSIFKGPLDISKLDKIGLPNNPSNITIHDIHEEDIPYVFLHGDTVSYEEQQIAIYRSSLYLDGVRDAVLWLSDGDCVKSALFQSNGKGAAVGAKIFGHDIIQAFYPNPGIDAISLLATLNLPIVSRQIEAYLPFELNMHLDDILVPTNKRTILDEIKRLSKEQETYSTQEKDFAAMKTEYINEVRMRKHDMGQYIFELGNIEDLMRYYLDNKKDEKNFFQQIRTLLDNFRDSLRELSTMLDNLSKEEQFGEPEPIDIHDFLLKLENRHQADGYKILTILDLRALRDYREKIAKTMGISVSLEDIDSTVPMIYISRNDLQRMVNNILDNAHKHGFTDSNRKDYEIQVWVSIDANKRMFQFDFRNNGNPLPEGMNKMRYGIKGEKAGKTGGTGMGGNYVKAFVEHYGGDYDIFMEEGWTVVRILLPIK